MERIKGMYFNIFNTLAIKAIDNPVFNFFIVCGGSLITLLIGSWLPLMTTLLIIQAVDIVSGVMASGKEKTDGVAKGISSDRLYKGLKKKGGMWLLIIVANQVDVFAFDNLSVMKTVVISYLIANEGLSILENLDRLGVKVPKGLTKFLEKLREDNEEEHLD